MAEVFTGHDALEKFIRTKFLFGVIHRTVPHLPHRIENRQVTMRRLVFVVYRVFTNTKILDEKAPSLYISKTNGDWVFRFSNTDFEGNNEIFTVFERDNDWYCHLVVDGKAEVISRIGSLGPVINAFIYNVFDMPTAPVNITCESDDILFSIDSRTTVPIDSPDEIVVLWAVICRAGEWKHDTGKSRFNVVVKQDMSLSYVWWDGTTLSLDDGMPGFYSGADERAVYGMIPFS